jgi:putative ABC transport system permease protein
VKTSRLFQITLAGLATHAFRSMLAALGVVLGVAAVVAMLAIGEGAKRESLDHIEAMGIENIVLRSIKPNVVGASASEGSSRVEDHGITTVDVAHIQNTFENVEQVVPVRDMRKRILANGKRTDIKVMATTPAFLKISHSTLIDSRSRFITAFDSEERNAVCVLGKRAARTLVGIEDPIGSLVPIGGISFRVVGIMENPADGKMAGTHRLDNLIYVPLEAANALFGKALMTTSRWRLYQIDVDYLYVRVADIEQLDNTVARLRAYLQETHDKVDYKLLVPYELLKQKAKTQRIFSIVMGSIAAISLLVGGIGIMNIMLANIYERTREIGTRRALGAKRRDILLQFLAESVVLTGIGGLIGLAVGVTIAHAVQTFAEMRTDITPLSIGVSLFVSIATGVVFGTYPANKAANLDPIVALRHE